MLLGRKCTVRRSESEIATEDQRLDILKIRHIARRDWRTGSSIDLEQEQVKLGDMK